MIRLPQAPGLLRQRHLAAEAGVQAAASDSATARLSALADSINDTARMARTTLTLALLVALYLGVTLISSTDENLFRNGQVVLPQVGVGISVVQSYIFAPPVFVFLHAQALLLLTVLARKVRRYETVLGEESMPAARRDEYWDWLSGFAFVQLYRTERSILHPPRILSWLGTNVVPLGLLAMVIMSFVRYQSDEITLFHKALFAIDLGMVALFNWQVHRRRWPRWRSVGSVAAFAWRLLWQVVAVVFAAGLFWYAEPPRYAEEARVAPEWPGSDWELWRTSTAPDSAPAGRLSWEQWWVLFRDGALGLHSDLWNGKNVLDAGPCEWWGYGCRYLDVRDAQLVKRRAEDRFGLKPSEPDDEKLLALRRAYSDPLDLSRRNLRFARLDGAFMPEATLSGADLKGASGDGADLTEAEMGFAALQGAYLAEAQLQGANLHKAQLQGANLWRAQLQGANLFSAQLQGADLESAKLQGADLENANLQGASLSHAQLQGADLIYAQLQGADLSQTRLQGAVLFSAQLQGANLYSAQLQGADLSRTQLQGADLSHAKLQGAFGKQVGWRLAWMGSAQFSFAPLTDQPEGGTLYQRAEHQLSKILTEEMQERKVLRRGGDVSVAEHVREHVLRGVEQGLFSGASPAADDLVLYSANTDLPEHRRPPKGWPKPPETDNPAYWLARAEWTAGFACEDEHTARSSLSRWGSKREGLNDTVREALMGAREVREDCPGLKAIPEEEWQRFVEGQ